MRMLRALVLLAALASPRSVEAAWALDVAWATNHDNTNGTSISFTYGSAVQEGALLVCGIWANHGTNGDVTSVDDNSANGSWVEFAGTGIPTTGSGMGGHLTAWYYIGSVAATPVVTAQYTASVGGRSIACGSYIPTAGTTFSFDVGRGGFDSNQGTGSDAQDIAATGVTAVNNELAIGILITQNAMTITKGTAWDTEQLNSAFGTVLDVHVQDDNIATPATVVGAWTINNGAADFNAVVGVFKETAAASGRRNCALLGVCGDEH